MTSAVFSTAPDAALEALFVPFETGALAWPADGRVLFLRARDGFRLREMARPGWVCEQSFKPFAEALQRSGLRLAEHGDAGRFSLVMLLPPRQRDEARALFAQALERVAPGGVVLAAVPNAEGAKSAEGDLMRLAGAVQQLSKHKCRVFWTSPLHERVDGELLASWRAFDAPQRNDAGYVSRPGLFAWDRVDAASALLADHLPADLAGHVADLGAGYGYLSTQLIRRCPAVTAIDLYEAEARALEPARLNLEDAQRESDRHVEVALHWHDVTQGLGHRYDVIVSNPPFHQGREDLPALGRAFIQTAAEALRPHGRLWLVANRHLPYEATLASRFADVRTVTVQEGFKVIEARGVHA
ncbi:class I SAM-dependent methyltransferase [Dyella jiangningensis]|uniref:16S rRNA methyltransferase n=1 Tax=Dyella jiangningensis TaxID=1379159 RepID=A0A328P303_9GAMM|nr:class I SAM-dependent methyltransferase [Dyella jiangningensis]RAO75316.1 16S rRNA methyltransferase [Dyella jiangningensis]